MALAPRDSENRRATAVDPLARAGVLLRRLAIRCPATGLSSDTGVDLLTVPQLIGEQMLVDCLECGQDHQWQVEDLYLD